MSVSAHEHPDAITLARTLATALANQCAWTDRGDADSDDAIGMVATALNPDIAKQQTALEAELAAVLTTDQIYRLSAFFGDLAAHHEDAGYLFGLAAGQLIRIPALMPSKGGAR